ncbi:sensor histidine kinase [Allokutzneria albata]|uniref:histidine kinase n=1 Tax=Allokutzneria albata TaxID=211114 RepID=A0A1G9V284_ALLAB|nr:ATP-binding protein [Allokutzneria albata]SDM66116.1 Histidine kinase-, DNA gyrase B-, and HSP90-like ATPase [Allokutzneria albata]
MSAPTRPMVAATIAFCCVVVTVLAWTLLLGAPGASSLGPWYWAQMAGNSLRGLAFSGMGLLAVLRWPRQPLAWLFVAAGITPSLYPLLRASTLYELSSPVNIATDVLWELSEVISYVVLPLLPLYSPDGALPSRRWRPMLVALPVVALAVMTPVWLDLPLTGALDTAVRIGAAVLQALWTLCLVALYGKLRRARGFDRRQTAVILVIFVLMYLMFWLNYLFAPTSVIWVGIEVPTGVLVTSQLLATVILLPTLGFVLTRTRLHQLDRAARATLVAVTVVGGLVLCYVALAALLSSVWPAAASTGAVVVAAATGLAGFGLRDAGRFVRLRVDRAFYGDRAEPFRVLRALPRRLNECLSPNEIPFAVCQTVVSVLRLPAAAIEVDGRRFASAGTADGEPTAFDLGRSGRLLVWPRSGQRELDELDIAALEPVVEQTAAAIGALVVGERLERSIEEERLRLRRDLHDGLGPALAGVTLQLGAVRTMLPPRSDAGSLLSTVMVHMRQIVVDFRRVTRNERPLLLEEHGLRGALVELCRRLSTPETPVTADLPDVLPSDHEEVVFHVAAEALANAVRHAGAWSITLRVAVAPGSAVVEVCDDGAGIAEPVEFGVGLTSMAERVRSAGGDYEIDSGPAGTTVRARFPLEER